MFREVYDVDAKGFIIDNYVAEFKDGKLITNFEEMTIVTLPLPQPLLLIKPKFNGIEWVEGETDEEKSEREAKQLLESLKPSPSEIAEAELEIKIATMLTELGVIS